MTALAILSLICFLQLLALFWAFTVIRDLQERLSALNRHRASILPPDDIECDYGWTDSFHTLRRRNPPC